MVPVVINRRNDDKFHIDWSLNITSIIGIIIFMITMIKYGNDVITYLGRIDSRTNIMWTHFDKNQLSKDELETVYRHEK